MIAIDLNRPRIPESPWIGIKGLCRRRVSISMTQAMIDTIKRGVALERSEIQLKPLARIWLVERAEAELRYWDQWEREHPQEMADVNYQRVADPFLEPEAPLSIHVEQGLHVWDNEEEGRLPQFQLTVSSDELEWFKAAGRETKMRVNDWARIRLVRIAEQMIRRHAERAQPKLFAAKQS